MASRLLLIAYSFPPKNESGAARPFRFYRYLPDFGVSPLVVTAAAQEEERPDVLFVRDVPEESPGHGYAWHLERVARKLLFPGEVGLTWSHHAVTRVCRLNSVAVPSAVLSTSPPFSAHLAAIRIKKRLRIPWIADFRDPMVPCPPDRAAGRLRLHALIEAYFLRRADAVLVNTDTLGERWIARAPELRSKLHVIWNGFDPAEDLAPAPISQGGTQDLVHVGSLYGGRHPGPLLASIQRLAACGVLAPGSFRLSLIGFASDDAIPPQGVARQLIEQGLLQCITVRIPQEQARLIACRARGLLLLQPHTDTQVPAKLFDYIRIGRPVLAFVMRDSPAERVLSRSGILYRAVYPHDSPEMVDTKLRQFLALPSDPANPSAWFQEQFNGRFQVQALARIVHNAVGRSANP